MSSPTRRQILGAVAGAFALPPAGRAAADPWAVLPELLKSIRPPMFPARDFSIARYGAQPDSETDCTDAFRQAIEACSRAGGGRVLVPSGGAFLTGAIHLKSNVNLHVPEGARILFSRDPKQYLPRVFTRWEGMELMNYSSFIYAFEQHNIAITGTGTLDGNCDCENWWHWKGRTECGWSKGQPSQQNARDLLQEMAEKDVPVEKRLFGEGSYLRPMFIQPYRCTNVLIEGVTVTRSPMYELHPVLCRNVTVRRVKVSSHGPNNDGCDPESCDGVLIDGCTFDTGDDCIAIKSGRNRDGRRVNVPSANIVVQNCQMKDGHGGVTLGSECSGGIHNVYAQDCRMDSPHLDRVLRIKTNAVRGGVIENVYLRNIEAGQVAGAVVDIDFHYEEGATGSFPPVVRNVEAVNVNCRKSANGWSLRGLANAPIRNVRIERCQFGGTSTPNVEEHVEGLALAEVKINGEAVPAR
jgi:polygalacturonase